MWKTFDAKTLFLYKQIIYLIQNTCNSSLFNNFECLIFKLIRFFIRLSVCWIKLSNFWEKVKKKPSNFIYTKRCWWKCLDEFFYCFYIYCTFIWIQLIEFSKRKLNCLFVHFNRFIIRIEVKEQFWMRIEGVWWCGGFSDGFFMLTRDRCFSYYLFSF